MTNTMTLRPMHKTAVPFWDTFFDDFFAPVEQAGSCRTPLTDIKETPTEYVFEAEFPGFKEDELEVKIDKNHLILKAEKKSAEEQKDSKSHYIMSERYEKFSRSFTLPDNVDTEKIKATFENGLLKLEVPKMEKAMPKTIKIN